MAAPAIIAPRHRTVSNGAIDLHVVEEGNPDGPTVVLVHGWPDTHALWDLVVESLRSDHHIVRFDNRGAGRSSIPSEVADFRIDRLASDLSAVVDAVADGRPVHLVGHDWGGVVGWEAVRTSGAAARFASFTSISGPDLDHLGNWMRACVRSRRPRDLFRQVAASGYTVLFQIPGLPVPALRYVGARIWPGFVRVFDRAPEARIDRTPTLADDMVHGLKLYRANIRERLMTPFTRHTSVPVQLVVDTRDLAVREVCFDGIEDTTDTMVRTHLRAGHWSPRSHPGDLADAIARFVAEYDRSSARPERTPERTSVTR